MIISASRRTDIPAFYSEWFVKRIRAGYVLVRNPLNGKQISKISLSPEIVDCIVFWSKYPANIIKYLPELREYNYYFLFTVNSYDESIEPGVPPKPQIVDTFKRLSDLIGPEKVIWRYDPVFFTEKFNYSHHLRHFEESAATLCGKTEKCIISFLDLYKKCERNMRGLNFKVPDSAEVLRIAEEIAAVGRTYKIRIETCAEPADFEAFGIKAAKCIDGELISRISGRPLKLRKDKNQRKECGCVESIDIGAYDTCPHNCLYCYANLNKKLAGDNYRRHNPDSELINGKIPESAVINERKVKSAFAAVNSREQMTLPYNDHVDK
jgi:hypothetical protein